jgi:tRNA threonylcarbamoyladenosine biosynthesis protein TsaE
VEETVVSPSFLLHRIYQGRLRLNHFDFYRMETQDDLESIGFFDVQAEGDQSVAAIEWAEKFPAALDAPLIRLTFTPNNEENRRAIRIEAVDLAKSTWNAIARAREA